MSKQIRYYVSRKNPLTWLAALMAVASVVMQILALCFGEAQVISTWDVWCLKVLPIAVALGFALDVLLRGPKEFYRTSRPVFWACVYFALVALDWFFRIQSHKDILQTVSATYQLFAYKRYVAACWILYLSFYIVYRLFVTGKFRQTFVLSLISLVPVAVLAYDLAVEADSVESYMLMNKLSNLLMVCALFTVTLAMKTFSDGKYHPTWGDRKDGRRVRTLSGITVVAGYIMPDRNDACNNLRDTIEISAVERYIHRKRAEGLSNFGMMHVFLATYVRCVSKYPSLNRFFSGQRIYQRDDDIQFTMTVKKDMSTESPDTTIKLHLTPKDTAEDVYNKLNAVISEVKTAEEDSSLDNVANLLASIPGLILKFIVWFLKLLDYFGKLPTFLTDLSPFHGSVIFTSMGSLGIPPVVHHLYNFGNLPVFLAFGRKYRKTELNSQGELVTRRYVDITLNCDERTNDGFYYATVLKYFQKILRNPAVLDEAPEEVLRDID